MKKRLLALAMSIALISQPLARVEASSVFADIATVPWAGAAAIMEQAYSYGLLNGYVVDGVRYARPNATLAYSEAVQLAYSIMKVYTGEEVSSVVTSKWSQIMTAYSIPAWLHPAASYCLEEGFLDPIKLGNLKDDSNKITREEVGVLFGKALASVYGLGTSVALPYNDANLIQSSSYPYLALLYEKAVMTGDASGTFRPQDQINRAEIAVVTVAAFESIYLAKLSASGSYNTVGTFSGTISNLETLANGSLFLSVADSTGQSKNFTLSGTTASVTYNGQPTNSSQLSIFDEVTVSYNNTSNVASIDITKSYYGISHTAIYTLKYVYDTRITVADNNDDRYSFTLDPEVLVYINGNKSTLSELSKSLEEEDYLVTLSIQGNSLVTKIEAVQSSNFVLSGPLYYLSNTKAIIQSGSKKYEYTLGSDVEVVYKNKDYEFATFRSEYTLANANVTLFLDSKGYVYKMNINYMDDATNGTLEYINARSVKISSREAEYSYIIDANAKASINTTVCEIEDIVKTYKTTPYTVELTLDSDNDIVIIAATTKYGTNSAGTITDLTSSNIEILNDGHTYTYDLTDTQDINVDIDGKDVAFSVLKEQFTDYEIDVQLAFNNFGEVISISGENKNPYAGELVDVVGKTSKITIKALGVSYTYIVENDAVIELNDVIYDDIFDLESKFDADSWASKDIAVELSMSGDKYVTGIFVQVNGGSYYDIEDEIDEIVIGEYSNHSSTDLIIKKGTKTYSYDWKLSDLDGNLEINGKIAEIEDFEDLLDDYSVYDNAYLELEVFLDKYGNVLRVEASNATLKIKEGLLVSLNDKYKQLVIEGEGDINSTWEFEESFYVYYDLNDRYYDEDDYSKDFDGIFDLYEDALYRDDDIDVYVRIGGNGTIIVINITV